MPQAAVIYCRISKDTGTALGVKRQERDCREWCERNGWVVAEVLVDNDKSAYSGKARPEYRRLLEGIASGTFDAIVAWHPDRLHRRPAELEEFIEAVEHHRVAVGMVTSGDYDLTTPEGRLTARIIGAVARKESEDKSRRLRRKHLELAESGSLAGGGRRPFGYEQDRVTPRESEAAEVRDAIDRVIAGESVRSITLDWRDRGIATVTGAAWSPTTVKRLLCSSRIAGLRSHNGKVAGPAVWPAIVDADLAARARVILEAGRGTAPAPGRRHLLTGFVYCGRCEVPFTSAPVLRKGIRYHRYACPPDRGGCGRCGISGARLDELVLADVTEVLGTADLSAAVADIGTDHQADPSSAVREIEARQTELAEMFAAAEITRTEWTTARDALERRLEVARSEVVDAAVQRRAGTVLAGVDDLAAALEVMTLDQRRAVIASVVDRVVIAPTTKANNQFDPSRVSITWKA